MLRLKRYPGKSPYWYVRGTVRGVRVFESAGTADRRQAEAYRLKLERELWERGALGTEPPATFADAVNRYLDHKPETRFILPLLDHFQETPLSRIGQAEIDAAAQALYPNRKASTRIRQCYTPAIAILRHAVVCGLPGASLRPIKLPKVEKPQVKWANDTHLDAILEHCSPRLRAVVLVMTYTGLRISEVLRAVPADFRKREGWLEIGRTKTGAPAFVPLPMHVQAAVDAVDGVFGYSTPQGVNKALKRAAEAAGAPYLSTHAIGRHSFAARLLGAGYDIKILKEAGRWKKLSIVDETYGHLSQSRVHDAMRAVAKREKLVEREPEE